MTPRFRAALLPTLLLRLSAAFFVLTLASGAWLHWAQRWPFGWFGIVRWLHVELGWAALPLLSTYLVVHVAMQWRTSSPLQKATGAAAAAPSLVLVTSGVELVTAAASVPAGLVRDVHRWATLGVCCALAIHAGPALVRGVQSLKGPWRRRQRP